MKSELDATNDNIDCLRRSGAASKACVKDRIKELVDFANNQAEMRFIMCQQPQ